jgi:hypothetical protein
VGPHHGPAFALRSVLGTYLEIFKPTQRIEHEFVDLLHRVLWHSLDEFDRRIDAADRHRVAASVYFFGIKQPNGGEHLIPAPIVEAYRASSDLRQRFPNLLDLSVPENLMLWAKGDGLTQHPAIRDYFATLTPFSKRGERIDVGAPRALDALPAELLDRPDVRADEGAREYSLFFSRTLRARLADSWHEAGAAGIARCLWVSAKHRGKLIALSLQWH